jgi:hypothetical protein
MTKKIAKTAFAKAIKHKAPSASDTHDALKTTPPREAKTRSPNTITMTIRTSPEWRDEFKRYAFENKITISEAPKLGLMSLKESGELPEKKSPLTF